MSDMRTTFRSDPLQPKNASLVRSQQLTSDSVTTQDIDPKNFERTFQSLMGKRTESSVIDEEQLFAAAIGQQVKDILGPSGFQEYKLYFKIGMTEKAPGSSGPSAERSANLALKDLVKAGLLTQEQASAVKTSAFDAAQLDENLTKLFDGNGGDDDTTMATGDFAVSAQLAASKMFVFGNGKSVSAEVASATPKTPVTPDITDKKPVLAPALVAAQLNSNLITPSVSKGTAESSIATGDQAVSDQLSASKRFVFGDGKSLSSAVASATASTPFAPTTDPETATRRYRRVGSAK